MSDERYQSRYGRYDSGRGGRSGYYSNYQNSSHHRSNDGPNTNTHGPSNGNGKSGGYYHGYYNRHGSMNGRAASSGRGYYGGHNTHITSAPHNNPNAYSRAPATGNTSYTGSYYSRGGNSSGRGGYSSYNRGGYHASHQYNNGGYYHRNNNYNSSYTERQKSVSGDSATSGGMKYTSSHRTTHVTHPAHPPTTIQRSGSNGNGVAQGNASSGEVPTAPRRETTAQNNGRDKREEQLKKYGISNMAQGYLEIMDQNSSSTTSVTQTEIELDEKLREMNSQVFRTMCELALVENQYTRDTLNVQLTQEKLDTLLLS